MGSTGPSRYGLSSVSPPGSVTVGVGRGPRPRRGGRRRSFMQYCRSGWMPRIELAYPRRTKCGDSRRAVFRERRAGTGAMDAAALIRRSVDVVRRDSVLCLGRPPTRIPHAGPDDDSPRARRFVSPRASTGKWATGVATHRCLPVGRLSQSGRQVPRVSPIRSIRATHLPTCELRAGPGRFSSRTRPAAGRPLLPASPARRSVPPREGVRRPMVPAPAAALRPITQ